MLDESAGGVVRLVATGEACDRLEEAQGLRIAEGLRSYRSLWQRLQDIIVTDKYFVVMFGLYVSQKLFGYTRGL